MPKAIVIHFRSLILVAAMLLPSFARAEMLTIQGKVSNSSGQAIIGTAVRFRVQIYNPGANPHCIFYDETQTIDLSQSNGLFSIDLGKVDASTVVRNAPTTYSLERAISNRTQLTVDGQYCSPAVSGMATYVPNEDDNRRVVVQFYDPSTMSGFETIPEMDLNPSAFSIEARNVGGYSSGSLLRVVDTAGNPASTSAYSQAQIGELTALIGGSSTRYLQQSSTSGIRIPSAPSTPVAGSIWYDSGVLKYSDGSSTHTLGTGSGTVSGISAGTGISISGTTSAPTINLGALSPSPAVSNIGDGSNVPTITVDAFGRITTITTTPIASSLPSGAANGEFIKYSGGAYTHSTIQIGDLKSNDGSNLYTDSVCTGAQTLSMDTLTGHFVCKAITSFSGSLSGEVTGTQGATVVSGASPTATASSIVRRDASAGISAAGLNLSNAAGTGSASLGAAPGTYSNFLLRLPAADGSNNQVLATNGSGQLQWISQGGTSGVSVDPPLVNSGSTISLPAATNSVDGYLTSADRTSFAAKLSSALASMNIFVGNSSGVATAVPVSGDLSVSNAGAFTLNKIGGVGINTTAAATGKMLRFDGTNFTPGYVGMGDLRSKTTGVPSLGNTCSASQTLTWDSVNDTLACQNIGIAGTQITSGTIDPSRLPASVQYWQAGTPASAIAYSGGNVGIGTTATANKLDVNGAVAIGTYAGTAAPANGLIVSGKLSVGESSPGMKFNVADDGGVSAGYHWLGGFYRSTGNYTGVLVGYASDGTTDTNGMLYAKDLAIYTGASGSTSEKLRISAAGNVGIGSSAPSVSLDLGTRTDAIRLPNGTNGQQPASTAAGLLRYNTSTSALEFSNGSAWNALTAGAAGSYLSSSGGTLSGALTISSGGLNVTGATALTGAVSTTGNFAQSGATTFSTGTGAVSLNGPTTVGSNLTVSGTSTLNGQLNVTSTTRIGSQFGGTIAATDGSNQNGLLLQHIFAPSSSTTNSATLAAYPSFSPPSGSVITNAIGLQVQSGNQAGAGSVTNGYGLYVNTPTYGTNKYAAYFGGSVGMGTTAPAKTLEVSSAGTTQVSGIRINTVGAATTGAGGALELGSTVNSAASFPITKIGSYLVNGTSGLETGDLTFAVSQAGTMTEAMRLQGSSGNLGIGVSSPSHPLTIQAQSSNNGAIQIHGSSADSGGMIRFVNYANSVEESKITSLGSNALAFSTFGAEAMRIIQGGNVGIGTAAPASLLDVGGIFGTTIGRNSTPTNGYLTSTIGMNTSWNGSNWLVKTDGITNAGAMISSDVTGAIGLFTIPSTGSSNQNITDSNIRGYQRLTVLANGNVGIGTTNPTATLDLNGTASVNSSIESASSYVNSSTGYTISDSSVNIRRVQLTANSTITLPSFTSPAGKVFTLIVMVKQDSTGGRTLAFTPPSGDSILWDSGASMPGHQTTASKVTIYQFTKPSDETSWYASQVWKQY